MEHNEIDLSERWLKLCRYIEDNFQPEGEINLDGILFLIGVHELGMGARKFSKDEKLNLLHIAICTVLQPYGYYRFEGLDPEGWPHFELVEPLPVLKPGEQSRMMKEAVLQYFDELELDAL
jgi:hypothetical protein